MEIGSFMGQVFTVSNDKILTPSNIKGGAGADWATHDTVGEKARSQYIAPQLRNYSFDLLLRAQDGVNPRRTLMALQAAAEQGKADWFVIGGRPLSENPFRIKSLSDEWGAVLHGGVLIECKVSISVEEYL